MKSLPVLSGREVLLAELPGWMVAGGLYRQVRPLGDLPGVAVLLNVFCGQVVPRAGPHLCLGRVSGCVPVFHGRVAPSV